MENTVSPLTAYNIPNKCISYSRHITIRQYDSNAEDKKLNKPCLELKIIFQLVYLKPFTHSCHSFIFNTFIPHQKISIFVFAGVRMESFLW